MSALVLHMIKLQTTAGKTKQKCCIEINTQKYLKIHSQLKIVMYFQVYLTTKYIPQVYILEKDMRILYIQLEIQDGF